MRELISAAALIATRYGGTLVGEKIFESVRQAALAKSAHGLPSLSNFNRQLIARTLKPKCRKAKVTGGGKPLTER